MNATINEQNMIKDDYQVILQKANNRATTFRIVRQIMKLIENNVQDYANYKLPDGVFYSLRIRIRKGAMPFFVTANFTTRLTVQISELGFEMDASDLCERIDVFIHKISSSNYGDVYSQDDIDYAIYTLLSKSNDVYISRQ